MKRLLFVLAVSTVCVISALSSSYAKPGKTSCPCGETKSTTHERMAVKDRSIPWESDLKAAQDLTVTEVLQWQTPDPLPDHSPTSTTTLPQEKPLRQVTAYIRLVKLSPDDCDYHMEVAATNGGSHNRMICEIPNTQEYCSLRAEFLKVLGLKTLSGKKLYTQKKAPKVVITGYPFFDVSHAGPKNRSGSKNVATSWEIHPVVKIAAAK